MLRRLSKRALETLEFRGALVVLGLAGALIVYVSLFSGHRARIDDDVAPRVPVGDGPPPARR